MPRVAGRHLSRAAHAHAPRGDSAISATRSGSTAAIADVPDLLRHATPGGRPAAAERSIAPRRASSSLPCVWSPLAAWRRVHGAKSGWGASHFKSHPRAKSCGRAFGRAWAPKKASGGPEQLAASKCEDTALSTAVSCVPAAFARRALVEFFMPAPRLLAPVARAAPPNSLAAPPPARRRAKRLSMRGGVSANARK